MKPTAIHWQNSTRLIRTGSKDLLTIDAERFRQTLLDQLRPAKVGATAAQLYLLYMPEQADPLALLNCQRRPTQLIVSPKDAYAVTPDRAQSPRLITLDCRCVAAYLLESDPALDDPLFEASITQAHAEYCLGQIHNAELDNGPHEFSSHTIGGWILSEEPANLIASRIVQFGRVFSPSSAPLRPLLRWTLPGYLQALWPTMSAAQRYALLGSAVWYSLDTRGQLLRYASEGSAADGEPDNSLNEYGLRDISIPIELRRFDQEQAAIVQNVALVSELLPACEATYLEQGLAWPTDAERQLHRHVHAAQQAALDAESVAIYALQAMLLRPGATEDSEWLALIQNCANKGLLLCDTLAQLSEGFLNRWQLNPAHSHTHSLTSTSKEGA